MSRLPDLRLLALAAVPGAITFTLGQPEAAARTDAASEGPAITLTGHVEAKDINDVPLKDIKVREN